MIPTAEQIDAAFYGQDISDREKWLKATKESRAVASILTPLLGDLFMPDPDLPRLLHMAVWVAFTYGLRVQDKIQETETLESLYERSTP